MLLSKFELVGKSRSDRFATYQGRLDDYYPKRGSKPGVLLTKLVDFSTQLRELQGQDEVEKKKWSEKKKKKKEKIKKKKVSEKTGDLLRDGENAKDKP